MNIDNMIMSIVIFTSGAIYLTGASLFRVQKKKKLLLQKTIQTLNFTFKAEFASLNFANPNSSYCFRQTEFGCC